MADRRQHTGARRLAGHDRLTAPPGRVAALGGPRELAAQAGGDGRVILVVDQFEELFTRCPDPPWRLAVAAAALLLIAVRADFYPLRGLPPMRESRQFGLGPMSTRQLRRTVRRPALDTGLQLEPELILGDLGVRPGQVDDDRAGLRPLKEIGNHPDELNSSSTARFWSPDYDIPRVCEVATGCLVGEIRATATR